MEVRNAKAPSRVERRRARRAPTRRSRPCAARGRAAADERRLQRWLAARRHFHSYSLANQLLIAMQKPDATKVAGFRAWLKLGYCVRKGETALQIWCPCPPSAKQLREWREAGADPAGRPRKTGWVRLQAISYRGRLVAACTKRRFFLAEHLEHRPPDDPERTFVVLMCAYAGEILRGELPGPYRGEDARRYARACLIPDELLDRVGLDVERVARALRVPPDELTQTLDHHRFNPRLG
jgi:N-terminal domain of anti-restriction factor ArdC